VAAALDAPAGSDYEQRVGQAEIEIDNLRAAFGWSRENSDIELTLALASALQPLRLTRAWKDDRQGSTKWTGLRPGTSTYFAPGNNRAENSHQPTRQRERAMKRFKSSRHAQRFLSAFSGISAHFRPRRHLLSATDWRTEMADRFAVWRQVTAPEAAA
jgi:hypothetical protein